MSELHGLAYLSLVVFLGSVLDGLPNILCEGLVGVGGFCQLAPDPCLGYFLVSVNSVIYVPSSFVQCLVGFFDLQHSLIGPVDRVAT